MKSIIAIIVIAWLVIGAVAAVQRGYFGNDRDVSCKSTGDTVLTIIAGPLNYVGANPKVDCKVNVPEPSK
jgi:hypothetical protein